MEILSAVLSIPFAWLFGTLLGHALRMIAPEEQKPLFQALQTTRKISFYSALILCALFLFLNPLTGGPLGLFIFGIFLAICLFFLLKTNLSSSESILLGICSAISSTNHYSLLFLLSAVSLYFCCQGGSLPKKKPILPLLLGSYQMPAIGIAFTFLIAYFF